MKIAIISDIHGNMEAFEQVLADIGNQKINEVISLGDNIGYGPEPDLVIKRIKARNIPSVQGNHELAIVESNYLSWFNVAAQQSLKITRALLSGQSLNFIAELQPYLIFHGCRFVHGFPPDSPLTYSFQVSEGKTSHVMEALSERLCFIGHTHTLDIISYSRKKIEHHFLKEGINRLETNRKYMVNVGSVGQPRDGNNKSKYAIWDSTADTIEVRFVDYDIAAVVEKIHKVGLPQEHADRLWGNSILI